MSHIREKAIVGLLAGAALTITRTFTEDETSVFGDTVACVFTITEVGDRIRARVEAILSNQHDEVVIGAWLSGVLSGEPERRLVGEAAGNLRGEYSSDAAFPRDGANQ